MKMKLNAVALAVLALSATGAAHAALNQPGPSSAGNSSAIFVAHNPVAQMTLAVDLGINMIDMIPGSALLSNASNRITWNFGSDTAVTNVAGLSITGNAWSTAYNTFAGATTSPSDISWGVIAADSVQGTGSNITATNAIAGRGWITTGNATVAQMAANTTSAPPGNGLTKLNNYFAGVNNLGNVITANNGAGIATSGEVYGFLGGNLTGTNTWNYLMRNGETSTVQYLQQVVANPFVFQLGAGAHVDNTFNSSPMTFTFDIGTGNLVAAVPEPGTYALMLAGLVGITFLARRRTR